MEKWDMTNSTVPVSINYYGFKNNKNLQNGFELPLLNCFFLQNCSFHLRSGSNGFKRHFAVGYQKRFYALSTLRDRKGEQGNARRIFQIRKKQVLPTHIDL